MSDTVSEIDKYLRQLAPHQKEREAAQLLIAAKNELSSMTQRAEAAEAAARISSAENVVLKKRVFQVGAKSKAVPEGWQLVPKEPTEEMVIAGCGNAKDKSRWIADRNRIYKAMLASAPQPETDIDQEQRFK